MGDCDILVIGAGAAGLMAALAARGAVGPSGEACHPGGPRVWLVNNEVRVGLKILVSGGGRCNVTNARLTERDYTTDKAHVLKGILKGFSVESMRRFFESRGCPLYEEPLFKVFPKSDRARDVLDVLLKECERADVSPRAPVEVTALAPDGDQWLATTSDGDIRAGKVILATGGKSLPKTGSRGFGFEALAQLGHEIVPPLPALTPLFLADAGPLHGLAGLTVPAVLTLAPRGTRPEQLSGGRFRPLARAGGSLLVTHKGASGPCALDVSGACALELEDGREVVLHGDFWSLAVPGGAWDAYRELPKPPGASLPAEDVPRPPTFDDFRAQAQQLFSSPEATLARALMVALPRALGEHLLRAVNLDPSTPVRQLNHPQWRALHRAVTQADLKLIGVEGYAKAEVTTGGLKLSELHRTTLESKRRPGLFVCGEVVNVTGRLGGFNFQWAWASGYAAGVGARTA